MIGKKENAMKNLFKGMAIASMCMAFALSSFGCGVEQPPAGDTAATTDDTATTTQGLTSDGSDDFIGGGGSGSCPAKDGCYWVCRLQHPCATNPSQCGPLGTCLTACDIEFPTCS
jgi:hypothetical protein